MFVKFKTVFNLVPNKFFFFLHNIKLFYYLCTIKTNKMKVNSLHHHHFHTCNQAS